MHRKRLLFYVTFVTTVLLFAMCFSASAATAPRMSTDELKSQLGSADLVVLDVRGNWDWVKSETQVVGSERVNPGGANQWASNYSKEKTIVLYCTWVNEATSARVAQTLMEMGYSKVYALKGGWAEWESKGYPVEPK